MNLLVLLFLGVVQGITEFLPVSSSAHLVILQHFFKFKGDRLFFDVMLHFATLLSVIVYFRRDIINYIRSKRLLLLIVVASIPTAFIGLGLKDFVEGLAYHPKLVALFLLVTAAIVWLCDLLKERGYNLSEMGTKEAIVAGVFQGLAVIPGISRSGSTVFSLLFMGLDRADAASFSFIMAIPAVAGATFIEIVKAPFCFKSYYIFPMVAAFLSGIFAIHVFVRFLKEKKFRFFSLYLLLVAFFVLIFG